MNKNLIVSTLAITAMTLAGCKGKDISEATAPAPEKQIVKT